MNAGNERNSLYTILVKSPTLPDTYQVGTAWAVSQHHLVTSAGVATELDKLRKRFSELSVFCPGTGETLIVSSYRCHPEFLRSVEALDHAANDAAKLQAELDEARNKAKQPEKDSTNAQPARVPVGDPVPLTELAAKLLAADEQYNKEEPLPWFHDIAILEVSETMPAFLEVAEPSAAKPKVGDKLTILGLPVKNKQVIWYSDEPTMPQETVATVLIWQSRDDDRTGPPRLIVRSRKDLSGQFWAGSPVVDADSKVVAVYSRPSPLSSGATSDSSSNFHEATNIAVLRDILSLVPEE